MAINLRKQKDSAVQTPSADRVQFYIDEDGNPKTKDSTGTTTSVSGSATALHFDDLEAAISGSSGENGFVLTKSGDELVMAEPSSGGSGGPATQLKTPASVVLDVDELVDGEFLWRDGTFVSSVGFGPDDVCQIDDARLGALVNGTGIVDGSAAAAPTVGQIPVALTPTTYHWQTPSGSPTGSASGDLGGTYPSPTVIALHSATTKVNVGSATAPTVGQVLTATSGTAATWQSPAGGAPSGPASGMLGGTYPSPDVVALKSATSTVSVSAAAAPVAGQVLTATSGTAATWQSVSISTGVTGLGTGVATALATPSSANIAAMCTDETGSGNLVFSNSPSLVTPNLGTPSALALTNATGRASAPQTADKIATSATAVSISNAAPAAGQALIASSATTAAWQDLPAGGGPATALRFSDLDAAITGSSGANGFVLTKSGGGLVMASPGSGGGPATQLKTPSGVVLDIDELEDGGFLWLDGTTISTPGFGPDQMAFINDPRFGALVVRDEGIVDCLAADPPTIGQVPVATSATTFEWQDPASSGDIGVRITGTSFSASVDHSYLTTTASGVTVTLPDGTATSNRGKRLTITFSGDNNTVLTVGGASNSFAPPFTSELISLSSGTYEFRANYIAAFSFALWSVGYSDGTLARRSIDVDFCLEGNFPINYVRAPVGAGRWTLTATVDTPSMPVVDGGGTFSPGETVLAPFDANYPGLYRVNVMNAPTDWQVELIEAPLNRAHLLGDSETEYRIRYGEAYGSRAFLSNGSRAGDIPINYALQAAPCAPYPTGHYLGTEFEFGGHLSSELLVGRTNIIDASSGGPFSFTLLGPDPVSSGTADGSSTTSTLVDLTANFPDSLTGKTLVFVDGANVGVRATITSVVDANTLEFSAVPALVDPPGSGDAYAIVDLSLLVGSRFAIKLNPSGSSSPGVGINIPLGYLIEDPVLAVTDSGASLLLRTGAYVEWLLDWSGTWMVVGYHQGFSGG